MSTDIVSRRDRARAFVPELIPEPADLDRTGPLDAKEQQQLDRIHAARDHHQAAKWMRGKALEAAFRRRLYRGEDGQRTRQQYLDDEWDGMSESAAYLEIKEWRLAAQIAETCERPAPDSHVRALVDVAEAQGCETVARWYGELRRCGKETGRRVTAEVVANLADYLDSGATLGELNSLFVPRQLPAAEPPRKPSAANGRAKQVGRGAGEPVTGTVVHHGAFQNFGMNGSGTPDSRPGADPAGESQRWALSAGHVDWLSTWLTVEAQKAGITPGRAADLLVEALADGPVRDWIRARAETQLADPLRRKD
ncbi:hypothetical protein [Streptomyces sp. NPDC006368]|uniref:hypothetical protein n=1 Tax=Streptomyces sp. NPDC006368 TaxID=3156760 RepID=UPI0033B17F9D